MIKQICVKEKEIALMKMLLAQGGLTLSEKLILTALIGRWEKAKAQRNFR